MGQLVAGFFSGLATLRSEYSPDQNCHCRSDLKVSPKWLFSSDSFLTERRFSVVRHCCDHDAGLRCTMVRLVDRVGGVCTRSVSNFEVHDCRSAAREMVFQLLPSIQQLVRPSSSAAKPLHNFACPVGLTRYMQFGERDERIRILENELCSSMVDLLNRKTLQ